MRTVGERALVAKGASADALEVSTQLSLEFLRIYFALRFVVAVLLISKLLSHHWRLELLLVVC